MKWLVSVGCTIFICDIDLLVESVFIASHQLKSEFILFFFIGIRERIGDIVQIDVYFSIKRTL